jgi:hypothetical protein
MPVLSSINIFPLKSASGLSPGYANLVDRGMEHDRRWMLVDTDGKFVTQRQIPRMSLITTHIEGNELILNFPGHVAFRCNLFPQSTGSMSVRVWDDALDAARPYPAADHWLSEALETQVHLVYMTDESHRQVDLKYARNGDITSFSDGFPLLLISQASLDDLNNRLASPVPMLRFRPNLVVAGCEAYAEDIWKRIRIADIEFEVVKPCSRCVIPTIDTTTGLKAADTEPLRTLSSYRRRDGKVFFGQNLIHRGRGQISVGDNVEVLE